MIKIATTLLLSLMCHFILHADDVKSAIVLQQEKINELVKLLDNKLIRLSEKLKESEPENAKLLVAAFKKSKEALLELKTKKVTSTLEKKEFDSALQEQEVILMDLMKVLSALTDEDVSSLEEIKRLEKMKKAIENMIKEQTKLKNETNKLDSKDEVTKNYDEQIKKLMDAIKNAENNLQETQKNRTKGLSHLIPIAKKIEKNRQEVDAIKKEIENMGEAEPKKDGQENNDNKNTSHDEKDPQQNGDNKGNTKNKENQGSSQKGKGNSADNSESSSENSNDKNASKANKDDKTNDDKKIADINDADKQKPKLNTQEKEPGVDTLENASDELKKSEKNLIEGDSFKSEKDQANAIKKLKTALNELEKEKERILSLPEDYAKELTRKQENLQKDLQKFQKEFEPNSIKKDEPNKQAQGNQKDGDQKGEKKDGSEQSGEPSENDPSQGEQAKNQQGQQGQEGEQGGDSSKGSNDQEPQQQQPENPVEAAKKYMQEASKKLGKKDLKKASDEQKKVIAELEKKKEEIDKTLAQLRQEEKEEKLANLESRFREILNLQISVKEIVLQLYDKKNSGTWSRVESTMVLGVARKEEEIIQLVIKAEDILLEDATTVVFPDVVKTLKEDMANIQSKLTQENVEAITQLLIDDTIQTLEELIESLKKAQQELKDKKAQGGQQGGKGGPNELVSKSAELKMLKKMQERVNRLTKIINEKVDAKEISIDEHKVELKRLHEKQIMTIEITKKINE